MSDLRYSPLNRKVVALLFSLLLLVASIIILIPEYIRSELELLLLLLLPGGPVWVDLVVQSQRNFVVLFYRSQWLEGRFQWIRAKRGRHRRQMTMRGGPCATMVYSYGRDSIRIVATGPFFATKTMLHGRITVNTP